MKLGGIHEEEESECQGRGECRFHLEKGLRSENAHKRLECLRIRTMLYTFAGFSVTRLKAGGWWLYEAV